MLKRASILILIGVLCLSSFAFLRIALTASEAPAVEWSKTYGGTTVGSEQSVVQTSDSGFAIASTADFGAGWVFWLIKTDSAGNAQWNKTYEGTAPSIVSSLVQTGDGGYAIVGNTNGNAWLVKTDSNGNMQWNKSYTEISSGWAWAFVQTIDGGYAIAGMTYPGYDGWLMKTDANGNMQWSRTFVEVNITELHSVVQTKDGGYIAAGATSSGKADAYVVKTDSDGNMTWSKEFSRTAGLDCGRSILQTSDGDFVIAGETDHFGNADFWLIETDASGNFLWDRTYGGTGWDGAKSIVQTTDGGYVLVGQTNSFGAGGNDFWLVKTDTDGNVHWNQTFGEAGDDGIGALVYAVGSSVVQTQDGGYALCGYTNSFSGDGSYEVWLIKLVGSAHADGWMNWLEGWKCRRSHTVNNATGAGSNYQVKIVVVNGTGTDSGGRVYVDGKCQPDFSDVRFTNDDGKTLQDYWLQSKYDGENATFWVKIDADLSSTDQKIYMYYGNIAVSTTSDFDDTFIFGDPFDNSSLDTSRWTSVDGVTAYSMNPTEHYLEVTDMTPNQATGVGFHSRTFQMPSSWIVQDAYSDEGLMRYHRSDANSDMFGQLFDLQNSSYVGKFGGVAYLLIHDGWGGDMEVGDGAVIGSDWWEYLAFHSMPYTTRWTMKRDLEGVITLSQNGIDRIARANNDTIDRMTWELERYENPGAGFGTERLYAFMVRKHVSPEPLHGVWGSEEVIWIVDNDGPADFTTIQEAINAASDGDTVFVRNGTYNEHITIGKPLNLKGENRNTTIIDGGYSEPASIAVVAADNVEINGFTMQHCRSGGNAVWIDSFVNMTFSYNIITGCNEGVRIHRSSGNVVSDNIVQDCYYNTGVGIDYGSNNTVYRNTIINNHYGISGGIDCHGNTFSENTIINNDIGFGTTSYDNRFFHNNFVNNSVQVITSGVNQFDDGYPSGGNYWSDYNGTDADNDGIGDSPYVVDVNNTDYYPLTNPWAPPDIAVRDLSTSKTIIGQGYTGTVNVAFENQGNKIEAFNASVYANSTVIYSESLMLAMTNRTLSFKWNTTGFTYGNYAIGAYAEPLLEELDIADNNCTCSFIVHVGVPGDISGSEQGIHDGEVNMRDIAYMIILFNTRPASPNWNPNADVNGDNTVNMRDIALAIINFNQHE